MSTISAFFSVAYRTNYGEQVYVCGSSVELGAWDADQAVKLEPNSDFSIWSGAIDVNKSENFEFKFLIKNDFTRDVKWEEQENRSYQASFLSSALSLPPFKTLYFRAFWQGTLSPQEALQEKTSAFKDVIFRKVPSTPSALTPADYVFEFRLKVFRIRPESHVVVYGNLPVLGNGNPLKGVQLTATSSNSSVWHSFVSVPASALKSFQYKYAIIDSDQRVVQEFFDREFELPSPTVPLTHPTFIKLQDVPFVYGSHSEWKGAGVSVPVFSLRTEQSLGVGEFLDIKLMAIGCQIAVFGCYKSYRSTIHEFLEIGKIHTRTLR
eukprot:TRINITY_DN8044_c0_g1_i1.p1 TRINITY_DN8044_c0_g1~~TRINITY_DN8044_c0_g1_i1.p1  ORF type:complete len:322 (+),score=49.74 TRINITY_DN8044_c0_g1_i1:97-1062(+)